MKAVRDRADARWLPSRHRFAVFRLLALVILRLSRPRFQKGLLLIVDRNQSALETYVLSVWTLITAWSYIAALLSKVFILPVAALLAFPAALLAIEIPSYVIGLSLTLLVTPFRHNERINSIGTVAVLAAASVYFAQTHAWPRMVALVYLGALAANGVAALIMFALRPAVAAAEARFRSEM